MMNQDLDLLTRSMVGRFRLGHEKTALFLAGSLFESLINKKLQDQEGWADKKLESTSLEDKINSLSRETLFKDSLNKRTSVFTSYIRCPSGVPTCYRFSRNEGERIGQIVYRLHNFRWLRNRIMHNQMDQVVNHGDNVIVDLINYLWAELAPKSFDKAFSKRKVAGSIIDTLYEHTADYMVRAIEEVDSLERDKQAGNDFSCAALAEEDFDNMFNLRRKLAILKNHLSLWLPEHAPFLKTDTLTTIDTTSAYIWMPLVPTELSTMENRVGVYDCSVSILATPLDLRIYMDFGGYARTQRKQYYDFLSDSPEYSEVIETFSAKAGFMVFDIDWYSFLFNCHQFSRWSATRGSRIERARQRLDSSPKPENSPITWNRCLHGYVFQKHDLGRENVIDFAILEQPLRDVIHFYTLFQQYICRISKEVRYV